MLYIIFTRLCNHHQYLIIKHFIRQWKNPMPMRIHSPFFSLSASSNHWASLVAQTVKNLLAMRETWVQFLGCKDPLEKGTATHSSILAWRIPWTEEPGGLQSIRLQRVGHDWVTNTYTATTSLCSVSIDLSILPKSHERNLTVCGHLCLLRISKKWNHTFHLARCFQGSSKM